jgi:hypothetical protein
LLDGIDINIDVSSVDVEKDSGERVRSSSEYICVRVQRRYGCLGDTALLQIAGGRSKPDACGDDAAQFIGASLAFYLELLTILPTD